MKKILVILMLGICSFLFSQDFDSAHRELRNNYNFVDSFEEKNVDYSDSWSTIVFANVGIAFLIEMNSVIRITMYTEAGNKTAAELASKLQARMFAPGGIYNIVSTGCIPFEARIVSTF